MGMAQGFTCDVCGKFVLGDQRPRGILPPDGWFQIIIYTPTQEKKIDVCSDECNLRWSKKRMGQYKWDLFLTNMNQKENQKDA